MTEYSGANSTVVVISKAVLTAVLTLVVVSVTVDFNVDTKRKEAQKESALLALSAPTVVRKAV